MNATPRGENDTSMMVCISTQTGRYMYMSSAKITELNASINHVFNSITNMGGRNGYINQTFSSMEKSTKSKEISSLESMNLQDKKKCSIHIETRIGQTSNIDILVKRLNLNTNA